MKKEYDLNKLKKRSGKVKVDKSTVKVPISIRLESETLIALKDEAYRLGLPYQTFISSILHQYVNGELISKKTVEILKDFEAS